ncbi:Rnf103 [Symbiodinium sp. CCMP2456]|nr:Rnf103 [Symbiodinium sp. CCMP2456]
MMHSLCCYGMTLKKILLVFVLVASSLVLIGLATALVLHPDMHESNEESRWIVVLIYPVALSTLTGAICIAVDHRAVVHWDEPTPLPVAQRKEVRRVWASEIFSNLQMSRPEFCSHSAQRGPPAEWAAPSPAPWMHSTPVVVKTCLCCLDDFEESNQVAILPCGHIFHEACIKSWSLSLAEAAGSCPACRAQFHTAALV